MPRLKTHTSGCKKCCCEACESRVKMVGKCCICLPQRICVELLMDEDENDVGCDTDGYDCDCRTAKEVFTVNCQGEYVGTVSCGSLSVDLRFVFEKNEYDECELCMYSDCLLGEGYKECVAADSYGEPGCCGPFATWEVDASDCGNENCGTATVTTSAVTDVSVREELDLCCTNCECVCECICIEYISNVCQQRKTACLSDYSPSWSVTIDCGESPPLCDPEEGITRYDVGITIALEDDGYGNCQLALEASDVDYPPDPIVLSGCPEISETWSYTNDYGDEVQIRISCANCDQECKPDKGCFCSPGCELLPLGLTLEFINDDCDCFDGFTKTALDRESGPTGPACGWTTEVCGPSGEIMCYLTGSGVEGFSISGSGGCDPTQCGPGGCCADEFTIEFDGGGVGATVEITSAQCDPFFLEAELCADCNDEAPPPRTCGSIEIS